MGYNYNINESKKDNKSTGCLFASHTLYNIIYIFTSTFLTAYIYTLTDGIYSYIWHVGIFEMVTYIAMFLSCWLLSYLVDRSNRVAFYRIGCVLNAGFVIYIIFFGKTLANYIVLAGLIEGVIFGTYYASYNVLKQEMVSRNSMKNYATIYQISSKLVKIVVPIVLGALIDISTYSQVAILLLVIAIIQIGISFGIKAKRPENSSFSFKDYFARLKKDEKMGREMKFFYSFTFAYGLTTILDTVLKVCVVLQFGSNFSLGTISSIIAIVGMVSIFLFSRATKFGKRNWLYLLLFLIPILGSILFVIFPNMATIVIFYVVAEISNAVYATQFDIMRNKNFKENGYYDCITEHQTLCEMIMCFARVLTFGLLICVSLLKIEILFNVLLVFFTICYVVSFIFLMVYEKRHKDFGVPIENEDQIANNEE